MTIFHSFIGVFTLALLLSLPAKAEEFFESLYDVPIMAGLTELPEYALSFDKPGGRIAEAAARLDTPSREDVAGFYAHALPAFGWRETSPETFIREGERLSIRFEQLEAEIIVFFSLAPAR